MAEKPASPPRRVTATVAAGNTVVTGKKKYGPGTQVELDVDTAASLRKRGVLVDPNAKPVRQIGVRSASVQSQEGPQIRRVV